MVNESDLLTFSQASSVIPGHPSPSTLWRWHVRGVSGIRLRTICVGSRRFVSRQALNEFIDSCTKARDALCSESQPDGQPKDRSEEVKQSLRDAGLFPPRKRGRPKNQEPVIAGASG